MIKIVFSEIWGYLFFITQEIHLLLNSFTHHLCLLALFKIWNFVPEQYTNIKEICNMAAYWSHRTC